MKEEPRDEEEDAKAKAPPKAVRKTPALPKDVSVAELLRELSLTKDEELLFLQLPDTLPGQPPTQDVKPIKTEVQGEDGQMVVIKQEKDRVCSAASSGRFRVDSSRAWPLFLAFVAGAFLAQYGSSFTKVVAYVFLLLLSIGSQAGRERLYLG